MNYKVTIDNFSGPLDLLLHLIKQSDIDIYDISVEEITNQYLNYINEMKELNLDIASEYLVMASELIEMKAKMLLPKPEITEDEYEEDPKENLIKRLIEYQNYKDLISKFQILESERTQYFEKKSSDLSDYIDNGKIDDDITLNDLTKSFFKFLQKKEEAKPLNTKITKKEFSINKRCNEIRNILKIKKNISFANLLNDTSKPYLIITFLSILNLSKNNEINIIQNNNFGDIILSEVER